MKEKKKLVRCLFMVFAICWAVCLPANSVKAKAAARLSHPKLTLTKGQKQRVYVYGLSKGVSITWKSSNASVASVQKGTITARKRGNAKITATLVRNKKKIRTLTCNVRVSEKPVIIASLVVSGEESEYVASIIFKVASPRSALLTNKVVLMTPGQSQQTLYLLDSQKILNSGGKEIGWLKSQNVRPGNSPSDMVVAMYARKDYRPFKVTSKSKAVFYFWYDGIKYKTSAVDLNSAIDPRPCKLTRVTPISGK